MKHSKRSRFALATLAAAGLALVSACNGPLGPIPGGRISGSDAAVPAGWTGLGDSGLAEIETNPSDPYSVTIAYTIVDGQLYANAGGKESRWAKNTVENPEVRLKIDGKIYDVRAIRVEDPAEIASFGKAWTRDLFRRDPTQFDELWLFRLVPRPAA